MEFLRQGKDKEPRKKISFEKLHGVKVEILEEDPFEGISHEVSQLTRNRPAFGSTESLVRTVFTPGEGDPFRDKHALTRTAAWVGFTVLGGVINALKHLWDMIHYVYIPTRVIKNALIMPLHLIWDYCVMALGGAIFDASHLAMKTVVYVIVKGSVNLITSRIPTFLGNLTHSFFK